MPNLSQYSLACNFQQSYHLPPLFSSRKSFLLHPRIICKASHDDLSNHTNNNNNTTANCFDRRKLLLNLSTATAACLSLIHHPVPAAPITAPDISNCVPPDLPAGAIPLNCCSPYQPTIIDFQLPSPNTIMRVRPAAHLVDSDYIAKYKRAVELMKALPADDPRNFTQQANLHCAYCDGSYDQPGFPGIEIQVHQSWLFLPWHRCYIYIYERILGKLICDDMFAFPF